MQNLRSRVLKYLAYIALGILIIIPFVQTNSVWRFVALIGLVITFGNFLRLVLISQELLDDFFPIKEEINGSKLDKLIESITMTIFFGGLLVLIFEINPIDNTIRGKMLFFRFFFIGLILAITSLLLLYKFQPSVFRNSSRRYSANFFY